ncbi:MAG TPA: VOC family protein [Capillimicrobium sp.]
MALEGLHHITAITADAQRNVDFYAGVLGLRMVKKTVNFDAPDVYHLYYGDETGAPGSIMTFFEFPGAQRGRAGAGMVHRVLWRVPSQEALAFWQQRLGIDGTVFSDPEGLEQELVVADVPDRPLVASAEGIPAEHALQGFHGVRAYAPAPERSAALLGALGFQGGDGGAYELRGDERGAVWHLDAPPAAPGVQAAGTVHHVAWSAADDAELELVSRAALGAGARPTPVIDRQYFHSVYFREPNGVLFELATRDIGFDADEPLETLGEALKLPPQHEPLRDRLEQALTPLVNPRAGAATPAGR